MFNMPHETLGVTDWGQNGVFHKKNKQKVGRGDVQRFIYRVVGGKNKLGLGMVLLD